ncbi:MAG: hypothetical protein N3D10_04055 [Candidatus Micrarchaeota archaeon]|nr:hypothetical protein [Candidatus Micrarchaeota archaeon]
MALYKKGQGASEYLILLAVVLIIGIIAIALLGGFSDIGSGARETESRQYWKGVVRPFTIQDWAQRGTTFSLTIKNMEPERLIITNITIGNVSYAPSGGISIAGGSTKLISISGFQACNETSYDYFEYPITIIYSSSEISGRIQKGEKPLVGPCQVS